MLSEQFDVVQFIGKGCYSIVYRAFHKEGADKTTPYAFKRFFLQNSSAVHCALRERKILERLALEDYQSPFLPTLFYSFTINGAPAFLLREGNGCDLFDLLRACGPLNENQARFYATQLIAGLEHLHSLEIVHLDLKPENILLSHTGNIFIADFDRSFDLKRCITRPNYDDFTGTPLFMAPEIAKGEIITVKADIWSLAVLIAELVSGPIRPIAKTIAEDMKWAKEGRFTIKGLQRLTKPLQALFSACLQRKYQERPDISGVKCLRFFKYVNWDDVRNCRVETPLFPSLIKHQPASEGICKLGPTDPLLLASAYGKEMPVTKKRLKQVLQPQGEGCPKLATDPPDTEELINAGMTPKWLENEFSDFEFINPCLKPIITVDSAGDSDSGVSMSPSQSIEKDIGHIATDFDGLHIHGPSGD